MATDLLSKAGSRAISLSIWNAHDSEHFEICRRRCEPLGVVFTRSVLLVNVSTQHLHHLESGDLKRSYSISSARNGVGQKEGSGKTPLGLHCVQEKIGDGADPLAIFKSRVCTGEVATLKPGGDAIVGRILRLAGLEEGINKGKSPEGEVVDTYDRYIYIHGTNDSENIGAPVSAGCIRMRPEDVVELYSQVPDKSLVYIYV